MVDADMVSCCLHALVLSFFVADLIVGLRSKLELHYRCRGCRSFLSDLIVRSANHSLEREELGP